MSTRDVYIDPLSPTAPVWRKGETYAYPPLAPRPDWSEATEAERAEIEASLERCERLVLEILALSRSGYAAGGY